MNEPTLEQISPDIRVLDESYTEDAWQLIKSCAQQLSDDGFDHWTNYYTKGKIEDLVRSGEMYGYFENGLMVAIVKISENPPAYYLLPEYTIVDSTTLPKALYVGALGTLKSFQKKGIATRLMKLAEEKASELGKVCIYLDTRVDVPGMVEYYRRLGYSSFKTIDEGVDGTYTYMVKELKFRL